MPPSPTFHFTNYFPSHFPIFFLYHSFFLYSHCFSHIFYKFSLSLLFLLFSLVCFFTLSLLHCFALVSVILYNFSCLLITLPPPFLSLFPYLFNSSQSLNFSLPFPFHLFILLHPLYYMYLSLLFFTPLILPTIPFHFPYWFFYSSHTLNYSFPFSFTVFYSSQSLNYTFPFHFPYCFFTPHIPSTIPFHFPYCFLLLSSFQLLLSIFLTGFSPLNLSTIPFLSIFLTAFYSSQTLSYSFPYHFPFCFFYSSHTLKYSFPFHFPYCFLLLSSSQLLLFKPFPSLFVLPLFCW